MRLLIGTILIFLCVATNLYAAEPADLAAAVTEIRKLAGEIAVIEAEIAAEQSPSELDKEKKPELAKARKDFETSRIKRTDTLRLELVSLSQRIFSVDPAILAVSLGRYDVAKQQFPISIKYKTVKVIARSGKKKTSESTIKRELAPIDVEIKGSLFLPKAAALRLIAIYRKTPLSLRPEISVKPTGEIVKAALLNVKENYTMTFENGEFLTGGEHEIRRTERESKPLAGKFIRVPGGCFQMGDVFGDGNKGEKPVHKVCLSDFAIGKYEITQGEWQKIMGGNPSKFNSCGPDCPVEQVNMEDVRKFVQKLNQQTGGVYRLPTEAEWEYAARSGGKNEKYSGGSKVDAVAWYKNNSSNKTHPVGSLQANGLGIYDMSGNVWEWVSDRYGDYSGDKQLDPTGHLDAPSVVSRGGSWGSGSTGVRTTNRIGSSPDNRHNLQGFRLALSVL
jgi:formylglycine-generating enzyme required for sulfatase activity